MNDIAVVLSVVGFTLALAAAGLTLRANYRLADKNELLSHDVRLLQMGCAEARDQFQRYAQIHRAKDTPEGDKKANTNTAIATSLTGILLATGYEQLGPMQQAVLSIRRRMERDGLCVR